MRAGLPVALALLALLAPSQPASAQVALQSDEQTLLHAELAYSGPFGMAGDDSLIAGGSAAVGVLRSLHPALLVGLEGRATLYARDVENAPAFEHANALYTLVGLMRVRLTGTWHDRSRGTGLFFEGGGGVGLSEALDPWPVIQVGVGWGLQAGAVDIVPTLRYRHVLGDGDSPLLGGQVIAGVGFTFFDAPALTP